MPNRSHISYLPIDAKDPISFELLITNLQQTNQLQGPRYNSRITRHFYPRSYGPGPMVVTGRARSQVEYQNLAVFIRTHHESIMTGGIKPIFNDSHLIGGYRHLLQLVIPAEDIYLQGWIDRFTLSKKGVFDPAPIYNFNFFIAHDPRTTGTENSFSVTKWFTPDPTDISATSQAKATKKKTRPTKSRNNKTPIPSNTSKTNFNNR